MLPPPLVRAFCAIVSGCRSTTRVVSLRYSSGDGGASLCRPVRGSGSLNAQCFTSPCPPCITAQRTLRPTSPGSARVSAFGKCRCASGIRRVRVDAVETQLAIRALEAERMRRPALPCLWPIEPFVHPPEMCRAHVEPQRVDDARDERQLLGGTDRPADADRVVIRALAPRLDVFERLGEVELLERVVQDDAEAGAREPREIVRCQPGRLVDRPGIERRVVPPVGRDAPTISCEASVASGIE